MKTVANSTAMIGLLRSAEEVVRTPGPILIIGARGTGKDFLARWIHSRLRRRDFRAVDCNQGDELLRKSLAGHYSFLRAEVSSWPDEAYEPGLIETTSEGTIYLDRIDLSPMSCARFLADILQGYPFTPMNGSVSRNQGDVQFVASCECHPFAHTPDAYLAPLLRAVFGNRILVLPTLSSRREDVWDLFRLFAEEQAPGVTFFLADEVAQRLSEYDWPANIWDVQKLAVEVCTRVPGGGQIDNTTISDILSSALVRSRSAEYARRARCGAIVQGLLYHGEQVGGDLAYAWVDQFAPYREERSLDPRDIAEELLRVLRREFYYDDQRLRQTVANLFRNLIAQIRRKMFWHRLCERAGTNAEAMLKSHIVVTNPLEPMKSPDVILPIFRVVSELVPARNAVPFSNLPTFVKDSDGGVIVVFVDDFMGSGHQFETDILPRICSNSALRSAIQSKTRAPVNLFMLVCVAFQEGLVKANNLVGPGCAPPWLFMSVLAGDVLGRESKAFDPQSKVFPDAPIRAYAESLIVHRIGRELSDKPRGYGDLESLVVFPHNTPNDTLPIIWKDGWVGGRQWKPLFPRLSAG